jgi:nucleoside-diphosphate-sugar epimerase
MKVLVVGHRGFIGPMVVKHLKHSGATVHGIDEGWYDETIRGLNAEHIPHSERNGINARFSDIDSLGTYDVIVWLAAVSNDHMGNLDEFDTFWSNYELPKMKAEDFWDRNPNGRFVYISSASVYGANGDIAKEDTATDPLTAYSKSKVKMDEWLTTQQRSWISLRLGTLWGVAPNMRRDLVVNAFVWEAIHMNHIHPKSTAKRPILNVDDAGWIISLGAILPAVQGIYNACAENVTVTQLADRIGAVTGAEVSPYVGSDGDKRDYWMDNSRLLYHFEIRESELAKSIDSLEIIDVQQALIPYNGSLRTRTDIYKEQLGK